MSDGQEAYSCCSSKEKGDQGPGAVRAHRTGHSNPSENTWLPRAELELQAVKHTARGVSVPHAVIARS